jgi:hypothetical protein
VTEELTAAEFNALTAKDKPKSKYGNVKTEVDGVLFDSKAEAERYGELKLMERNGEITDLQLQVRYPIEYNGALICTYVADFVYWPVQDPGLPAQEKDDARLLWDRDSRGDEVTTADPIAFVNHPTAGYAIKCQCGRWAAVTEDGHARCGACLRVYEITARVLTDAEVLAMETTQEEQTP